MNNIYSLIFLLFYQTSIACNLTDEIFKDGEISVSNYIDIYNPDITPELAIEKLKKENYAITPKGHLLLKEGQCSNYYWKIYIYLHPVVFGDDPHGLTITTSTYDSAGSLIDSLSLASVLSYEESAIEKTSKKITETIFEVCERNVTLYQYIDTEDKIEYFNPPKKTSCKIKEYSLINGRFTENNKP